MGPMMRAVVGDTIEVTLRNNLDFPINIIPEGVTYTAQQGDAVAAPGQTIKYTWAVPELVRLAFLQVALNIERFVRSTYHGTRSGLLLWCSANGSAQGADIHLTCSAQLCSQLILVSPLECAGRPRR